MGDHLLKLPSSDGALVRLAVTGVRRLGFLLSLGLRNWKPTACLGFPVFKCWGDGEGPLVGSPVVSNLEGGCG